MTNTTLTETQALVNLSAKLLNNAIEEAWGKDAKESARRASEILRINPAKDSLQAAMFKVNLFYLGCEKLPNEAAQNDCQPSETRATGVTVAEVRLLPSKSYVGGVAAGYSRVNVPYALPDKYKELDGYSHVFGNVIMLYRLEGRRQIKVRVSSEAEGHRAINWLLKIVDPEKKKGSSEDHSYLGRIGKNAPPHRLLGLTGTANRVRIKFPNKTSEAYFL